MKNILIASLILCLTGCWQGEDNTVVLSGKEKCYQAIDGKDTILFSFEKAGVGYQGLIHMNYGGKDQYEGQFKGAMRGDTLIGHYDFKVNKIDKWYRNPVAFLRNGENYTMGVGEITMVWGSGHFVQGKPIDYDKGRFVFAPIDCK